MALTTYQIPLNGISQTFTINLGGTNYQLTVKWNPSDQAGWVMGLSDTNANPIADCLPLITGADILSGLDYLGIGGQMIVYTDGDPTAVPTFDNLGTACNLYFVVTS